MVGTTLSHYEILATLGDHPRADSRCWHAEHQKSYLNPSWMILASPALLMLPKIGDVSDAAGFPRFTQFSRLNASARN
jgi:hypothetical protein